MNNRGFTLLELFAIISLLSLVLLVAVPQIISTAQKEEEETFKKASVAAFSQLLNKFETNEELTKQEGSWNCKDMKYENNYIFENCIITWNKKNPAASDLLISVVSSKNNDWKYENVKRDEISND